MQSIKKERQLTFFRRSQQDTCTWIYLDHRYKCHRWRTDSTRNRLCLSRISGPCSRPNSCMCTSWCRPYSCRHFGMDLERSRQCSLRNFCPWSPCCTRTCSQQSNPCSSRSLCNFGSRTHLYSDRSTGPCSPGNMCNCSHLWRPHSYHSRIGLLASIRWYLRRI